MSLAFFTLYAKQIEETAELYRILGMEFVEEQHGSGPVHLAATQHGVALEIYPGGDGNCHGLMLGFEVANLEDVRQRLLSNGIRLYADMAEKHGFRRLIAIDSDGRRVFVAESQ